MLTSPSIRVIGLLLTSLFGATAGAPAQSHESAPAPVGNSASSLTQIQRHQHPSTTHPKGEHLAEWMNSHRGLTPEQQQQALQREPGFTSLPPATQERMRERLKQLDAMSPEQRQRLLERNEAMEHLSPEQRTQVRAAMQQLAALPPDQRRYVSRTFRGLRELTPEQRQNVLNSERFSILTEAQRSTLDSLMKVEPLLPPPYDADGIPPPTARENTPQHP